MRSWAEYCMENFDSLIKDAEEKARLAAADSAATADPAVAGTSSAPSTSE